MLLMEEESKEKLELTFDGHSHLIYREKKNTGKPNWTIISGTY